MDEKTVISLLIPNSITPAMVSLLYFCVGDCIPARDGWLGETFHEVMSIMGNETRDRLIARPRWTTISGRLQDRTLWAHFVMWQFWVHSGNVVGYYAGQFVLSHIPPRPPCVNCGQCTGDECGVCTAALCFACQFGNHRDWPQTEECYACVSRRLGRSQALSLAFGETTEATGTTGDFFVP